MSLFLAMMLQLGLASEDTAALGPAQHCLLASSRQVLSKWPENADAEKDWERVIEAVTVCEAEIRKVAEQKFVELRQDTPSVTSDQVHEALIDMAQYFVAYTMIDALNNDIAATGAVYFPAAFQGAWGKSDEKCLKGNPSYLFLPQGVRHPELEPSDDAIILMAVTDNQPALYERDITVTLQDPEDGKATQVRMVLSDDFDQMFVESVSAQNGLEGGSEGFSPLFLVRCDRPVEREPVQ